MRPAVVLGGLTVYGLGVYSYVLYSTLSKDFEKCLSIDKRKRLQLFDENANSYDRGNLLYIFTVVVLTVE